jgi:D-arabinose 1-dehydrogenase-like Zn-dependent alcohol dehydrogenase
LILVSLGWLAVAVFTIRMFRVAAISDARRKAELAKWLAMNVRVEHRAEDHVERLPSESQPGFRRAAG